MLQSVLIFRRVVVELNCGIFHSEFPAIAKKRGEINTAETLEFKIYRINTRFLCLYLFGTTEIPCLQVC